MHPRNGSRGRGLPETPFKWQEEAEISLVAEWIHFTLFWIILPTIKPKVYTLWGL